MGNTTTAAAIYTGSAVAAGVRAVEDLQAVGAVVVDVLEVKESGAEQVQVQGRPMEGRWRNEPARAHCKATVRGGLIVKCVVTMMMTKITR